MRLRLLGLLVLAACTRDVYVPLEVVAPTGSGTLRLEVVITPEGSCGTTRPPMAGTRFDEGETPELGLERGSTALWVGAWEGDTCGAAACYAGCSVVDVRKGVDARVALVPTECANVCDRTSDAGVDAGLEDAGPVDAPPVDSPFDVPVDAPNDGGAPGECETGYVEVAAGHDHTCARRADGMVACWGANMRGESGAVASATVGPTLVMLDQRAVQLGAGEEFSCARLRDERVACWGFDGELQQDRNGDGMSGMANHLPVYVAGVTGATDLSVGYWHSCAVVAGGRVRCWGQNASGELGSGGCTSAGDCPAILGSTEASSLTSATQVAVGVGSSCALLSSGRVRCWGYNVDAQLAVASGASAISTPSAVRTASDELMNVVGLAGGGTRSFQSLSGIPGLRATNCGFDATGVTCWGANDEGQAAGETADLIGTTRAATPAGIVAMSLGDAHTCAIHGTARTLSCWGNDSFGQLGDGTVDAGRRGPTNVAVALPRGTCSVAAGDRHTCAALTDGSVFCWGSDGNGQLGGGGDTATPRALALPL